MQAAALGYLTQCTLFVLGSQYVLLLIGVLAGFRGHRPVLDPTVAGFGNGIELGLPSIAAELQEQK